MTSEAPCSDHVISRLETESWVTVDDFIDRALVASLIEDITRREQAGLFRSAGIGAGGGRIERRAVRGDRISWLTLAATASERVVLSLFEALRRQLNETLLLGLHDLESHFAIYDPGSRYVRHLDRSAQGAERVVSVVLYLNPGWTASQGGELLLYPAGGEIRVEPIAGRLVAFLSEQIEHEVCVSQVMRRSLTGWFRRRPVLPLG